ncbi:hypothetical protein C7212DRAFT_163969 [Tuber magnatum]|uniref:Uncharacterized protein n=1 Tax=Tuber magnatum TaxID=42249 RepID=A0A317T1E8_9PEZI|nr:hypothetical protein C7212DRAFT_163969 [Tuber magnatum]
MAKPFNSSHIQYGGQVFNETLLREFNYGIYSNGTLSNSSRCYLVFDIYRPWMAPNGSVFNGTKCDSPINPIATRGALGITFAVLYAVVIVFVCVHLRKHGATHLPLEKRFRLVSRRWQWYWLMVTCACGMISGFTAIDIDRDYLMGTPFVLSVLFYWVMVPTTLAAVWETTRHWGSFMERQTVEGSPFKFSQEDRRSKIEFYVPLVFYLFAFLTFFLSILRSWNPIRKGFKSAITDPRFRASAIFSLIAFLIIVFSLCVSIHYYKPLSRRVPAKIPICIALAFVRVVFAVACSWEADISPLSRHVSPAYVYALGYLPSLGIMLTMIVAGYREMNEDLFIKKLRTERIRLADGEIEKGRREKLKKKEEEGLKKVGE